MTQHYYSAIVITAIPTFVIATCIAYATGLPYLFYPSLVALMLVFLLAMVSDAKVAWPVYYVVLSSIYFWVGYSTWIFGFSTDKYVETGRIFVGIIQYLPFIAMLAYFFLYKKTTRRIKDLYLIWFLFVGYIVLKNISNSSALETAIQIRNFVGPLTYFMIGIYVSYVSGAVATKIIYRYIYLFAVIIACFGVLEYLWGQNFWLEYFPAQFVSDLKMAGAGDGGIIGNKLIGINHVVYYRLSSIFYTPPHAAYNLVFFALFFYVYFRSKYIKLSSQSRSVISSLHIICFSILVFLTLIKAGWGVYVIALLVYFVISRNMSGRAVSISFIKILLLFFLGVFGAIVGVWLYTASGVVSTGRAHIAAFMYVFGLPFGKLIFGGHDPNFYILNSDSGFATIVLSIGVVGYSVFFLSICLMIKRILENKNHNKISLMLVSLIVGWFMALHLTSSAWSPMGAFILFFSAGFFSGPRAMDIMVNQPRSVQTA